MSYTIFLFKFYVVCCVGADPWVLFLAGDAGKHEPLSTGPARGWHSCGQCRAAAVGLLARGVHPNQPHGKSQSSLWSSKCVVKYFNDLKIGLFKTFKKISAGTQNISYMYKSEHLPYPPLPT